MSDPTATRIKKNEGLRHIAYKDTNGIWTVGYGRNLQAVAFTDQEIDLMFANDLKRAQIGAKSFKAYERLSEARRGVIVEMCYQLGAEGVRRFTAFWDAVARSDWETAKKELLNSKWARKDSPARAQELAEIFYNG